MGSEMCIRDSNRSYLPAVIQRNILENPGWYTAYTPYQAEIAQGRLEALLNFQTMVCDLTKMEIANASLLDEGTSAAEAMIMMYNNRSRHQKSANLSRFFVDSNILPQTLSVINTRAYPLGIEIVIDDLVNINSNDYFGCIIQYPGKDGYLTNIDKILSEIKNDDFKLISRVASKSSSFVKCAGFKNIEPRQLTTESTVSN